ARFGASSRLWPIRPESPASVTVAVPPVTRGWRHPSRPQRLPRDDGSLFSSVDPLFLSVEPLGCPGEAELGASAAFEPDGPEGVGRVLAPGTCVPPPFALAVLDAPPAVFAFAPPPGVSAAIV